MLIPRLLRKLVILRQNRSILTFYDPYGAQNLESWTSFSPCSTHIVPRWYPHFTCLLPYLGLTLGPDTSIFMLHWNAVHIVVIFGDGPYCHTPSVMHNHQWGRVTKKLTVQHFKIWYPLDYHNYIIFDNWILVTHWHSRLLYIHYW